jgi:lysophospholipase L1-like esterase
MLLSFDTVSNQAYTVWTNNNFCASNWILYTNLMGVGIPASLAVPISNNGCFFRLNQTIINYAEPGTTFDTDNSDLPPALQTNAAQWWLGQHLTNFGWEGGSAQQFLDSRYVSIINNTNVLLSLSVGNSGSPGAILVSTDAQDLAFTTYVASTHWTLIVDGCIAAGNVAADTQFGYINIHFPYSRFRNIELHCSENLPLQQIIWPVTNSILPAPASPLTILVIGDSFAQNDDPGPSDNITGEGFYPFWMHALDPRIQFWNGSAGGTGFATAVNPNYYGPMREGTNGAFSFLTRLNYFTGYSNCNPDIVLWQCSDNDTPAHGVANLDQYTAAVSNSLAQASAAWPNAKLVIAGPDIWHTYDPYTVSLHDVCAAQCAAVGAHFIDWIGPDGSSPWLFGDWSGNPGNNPTFILSDHTHPNQLGARFIADHMLQEFYRQGIIPPPSVYRY